MTNPHRQRNRASPEHVESIRRINEKLKHSNRIKILKGKLKLAGISDKFDKDEKAMDFLSDIFGDDGPKEPPKPSPFPLPKYFEKDYEAFHDRIQDSAFRFEDANEAGINIEESESELQGYWKDLSEPNKGLLRTHYQKHLTKELPWQKNPKLYESGKIPDSENTYAQPGFHKNLTPMFEDEPESYLEINPKDIKPKFPKDYVNPGQFAKIGQQADKIIDSYLSSGLGYKGIDGVYDHENSTVLNGYSDVDARRMQDLFNGQGKFIGANSVTDTRAGSNHDIERVRNELREVEENGGIPALGFDGSEGGSLEALNISVVNSKEEVMNALSNNQWGTGILDPDRKFSIEKSQKYKGR
jgi:hypothetical protein